MAVIAVAGGTGSMGRTIVEALVGDGGYDVVILARKPNPTLEAELGARIIPVDYTDVEGLTKALEDNNVDTVISGISMFPVKGSPNGEIPLIRAADASKTTRRMVSSDYGIPHKPEDAAVFAPVSVKHKAQEELQKTKNLEHTIFYLGHLLDYYGLPKVKSYMAPAHVVLDMENNVAVIPGSGNVPVVWTHTTDMAKFVVASLRLEKWEPVSTVIGDRATWNEVLRIAEEVRGTKFKVTYDSLEKLKAGQATELPAQVAAYDRISKETYQSFSATFGCWCEEGVMDLPRRGLMNEKFPEIKTMKMGEVLRIAWGSD